MLCCLLQAFNHRLVSVYVTSTIIVFLRISVVRFTPPDRVPSFFPSASMQSGERGLDPLLCLRTAVIEGENDPFNYVHLNDASGAVR